MKVLVTGHEGYIGAVLVPFLERAGHEPVGLDVGLYRGCDFGPPTPPIETLDLDLRDVTPEHLEGIDAVMHLGALSNDPAGSLNPECTYDINYRASVRLAKAAKTAGVTRFLFSSSCSLYGAGGDGYLDESAGFNPVTPYGESKILTEQELANLADDTFSPTYLRNATVYGASPRLRLDLVVNNLAAWAVATGAVRLQSDGSPRRPLVHVDDVARAFVALLEAPRDVVHDEAFNVGATEENYRIRQVAEIVGEVVEGSEITFAPGAGADARDYFVSFDKIAERIPSFRPEGTVRRGAEELVAAYAAFGMDAADLTSPRYTRLARLTQLIEAGALDDELRVVKPPQELSPAP